MQGLLASLLGDPMDLSLLPPLTSYEDVHGAVQSILLPPVLPKGLSFHLLQPVTRRFALQHKVSFTPGDIQMTQMGPMPEKGLRAYALGGVLSHIAAGGGKWRVSGQVDPENWTARACVLGDVWGEGRLRLLGQLALGGAPSGGGKGGGGAEWAASATLRGEDYVAVARVKHGLEAGGSYFQRLAPGSPLALGGEMMLNVPELAAAAGAGAGAGASRGGRPLELAVGGTYDTEDSKTAVHYAATKSFSSGVLSMQHLHRVTERSHLAAKIITDAAVKQSMVAAGYRLRFRNTLTTLHGMIDSYGSVRQVRGGGGGGGGLSRV